MIPFLTRNLEMLGYLLDRGADPNKRLLGTWCAAIAAEAEILCQRHDIRKWPKDGCPKCNDRLLLVQMLALLRQHGGRPIVAGNSEGTGLISAYVDLIAYIEKWEERGRRASQALIDAMYNDPAIKGTLTALIRAGLGGIISQGPMTSLEGGT
jgi:hypothetical protein